MIGAAAYTAVTDHFSEIVIPDLVPARPTEGS